MQEVIFAETALCKNVVANKLSRHVSKLRRRTSRSKPVLLFYRPQSYPVFRLLPSLSRPATITFLFFCLAPSPSSRHEIPSAKISAPSPAVAIVTHFIGPDHFLSWAHPPSLVPLQVFRHTGPSPVNLRSLCSESTLQAEGIKDENE